MKRLFSPFVLLALCAAGVRAQATLGDVKLDQRVRVETTDARRTIGYFVSATTDSLVITLPRTRQRRAIALERIRKVEASAGRRIGAGVKVGLLAGLVGGVGLGLLCIEVCPTSPGDGANLAPVGGLFFGPPVGALLGAVLAPEKWRVVLLR